MVVEPFIGQVFMFAGNFSPKGYAFCNGQLLPISQNQALFSLLGTTYGGNGQTTFALPDLRGRIPVHAGNGFVQGQTSGETTHTLTTNEMPAHTHLPSGASATGTQRSPQNTVWAASTSPTFSDSAPNTTMAPQALAQTGGNQPHDNMPPYQVVNFIIALIGVFPSRN
jgi:microcystin-dependent protein